jgi:hypothetical protein
MTLGMMSLMRPLDQALKIDILYRSLVIAGAVPPGFSFPFHLVNNILVR